MPFKYPHARKDDVVEDFHGMSVADPYRWLEDPQDPGTIAFTKSQNAFLAEYMKGVPEREQIKKRLEELWSFPVVSAVARKGNRIFFSENDGSLNQPILYKMDSPDAEPQVLLDPNKLSEDGTIALMSQYYTSDGEILAYSLAESGSDWQEVKIINTVTGEHYPETLRWTRFPSIAWNKDKSGFYYSRQPEPGTVAPEDINNYRRICWHTLGTDQSEDREIFQHEQKTLSIDPDMTDDGKYMVIWVYRGTDDRNGLYYMPFNGGEITRLLEPEEAAYQLAGGIGDTLYLLTDLNAPNRKVVTVDLNNPAKENWRTLVPETEDAIQYAFMAGGKLVVIYLHHAAHIIKLFELDGAAAGEIPLPAPGTITLLDEDYSSPHFFFQFASFLYPDTAFEYNIETGTLKPFREATGPDFNTSLYETTQHFYTSKDGTRVPIFLTHRKGIKLDGNNPTILYGYGGFNISQTPFFKVWNLTWIEMGGIFALANLRGGTEYGEEWHQQGMLDRKQNVFDDLHSAAEWLIEQKYTSTPRLAIEGRSNGGLLTAATMLQRPDLYGAVLSHVPVIDMLRYHKFTLGHYWIPEYGDAETNPDHFKFLYAYSPLHNVKPDVVYPPIIITTADTDDRVVPSHSKKFAATLQNDALNQNPVLLRIETRAGHGLGKPIHLQIEERADVWAFLVKTLNMEI